MADLGKKRKLKTTPQQYLYLEVLETNRHFRENKITPENRNELSNVWEHFMKQLNSSGGPQKSISEWKRVFIDWKSQVRKRVRLIKQSLKETGNNGEPEKELTEVEKKLLYLTGEIVVEGIKGVPELGIENEANISKAVEEEGKEETDKTREKKLLQVTTKSGVNDFTVLCKINSNFKKLVELKETELQIKRQKNELNKLNAVKI